ncbi:dipeptide transport ATP-binding protein DppD [Treponema primitia ZAS-2]|uniref:Dipeptide transport ATP-binding protein DppD n=1 Tax=Treponema primitia (strain ATCC BAA-887 / DSM 12427 / ZAS-2) TaxID=545694 RepID=F5YHF3_TREPZ|nr:ABC transporter ATP-binding protein [Treponema primitia]AEF86555.1 dipeptide transport ATP-binding protein DppD [Treponema primitia ZAS-2]
MEELLRVQNLCTSFFSGGAVIKAVNDVSFTVMQGETFGLVGESGCGKSAICRSISRLIRDPGKIMGGQIIYRGTDIMGLQSEAMRLLRGREISMIFQEPMTALNPVIPIKTQIYETLDPALSGNEKRDRTIELLRLVGIPHPEKRMHEYIHQFSGGMRQRVMIAIALASNPKLLLADEPTTALDVTIQNQIMELINSLREKLGMSLILVTHDLSVVSQMCDFVAVMYAGRIMELCDTVTLFTAPRHPYTYGLLNSIPSNASVRLEPIAGSPPNLADPPPGCPFAPRCKFKEDICDTTVPELLEIESRHSVRCHFSQKLEGLSGLIETEKSAEQEGPEA